MGTSPAECLQAVLAAERSGDHLGAYDLATRGLEAHPGDLRLAHRAVLALARSGATAGAQALLETLGLRGHHDEDVAALEARLAKDRALAAIGGERVRRAGEAAALYGAIHTRTRGTYPGINAATMSLLAGDEARAAALAAQVLAACAAGPRNDEQSESGGVGTPGAVPLGRGRSPRGIDDYYLAVTEAEAALLLGQREVASAALARARACHGGDHAALATTRRQLRLICDLLGLPATLLEPLATPPVVHYTGHQLGRRFPAAAEAEVASRIAAALDRWRPGYGFGALASGADLLFAEALLARGAALHVVLPFGPEEFCRTSVAPAGPAWVARFEACLGRAASVTCATQDASDGDDVLYAYGARLAMGLAILRARFLDTTAIQLAVWDGGEAGGGAGTTVGVATWQRAGGETEVIEVAGAGPPPIVDAPPSRRAVRAMLFGDVKGFSKLDERQVPIFVERVLGAFGRVLDRWGDDIQIRATWGDGLYIVVRDVATASRCALALQDAMAEIDLAGCGLPPHLALRLAAHVGPVFECFDGVAGHHSFFGTHVTRTARIEPVTPEGEVFVSEPFAAAVALEGRELACEYVGLLPTAKGFGAMRMCVLRRGTGLSPSPERGVGGHEVPASRGQLPREGAKEQ